MPTKKPSSKKSTNKPSGSTQKESSSSKSKSTSKKDPATKRSSSNLKPLTKAEEKAAKKTAKRKKPRWKRWLKRFFIFCILMVLVGAITVVSVFAWFAKDLPSADQLESRVLAESTKIYDRTGEHLLYETGQDVRRTYTKLEDMNPYVHQATIALEDKNFYEHMGFDPIGILRSAGINIATDNTVGGSTITQQFVKLAIVGSDKTYSRKIKELILSVELERKYDKDQILEFYLNEASYGGVNLGVAAGARSYFDKTPAELTLAEAALLASIPQRPTYFVSTNREALYERKDFALDRMAEEGFITQEEAETAKEEDVQFTQTSSPKVAPHFVDYVLGQIEQDFGSGFINQGLVITTSVDLDKQRIAEEVIANGMGNVEQYGGSNASIVSIDTHTGQVLAMVGSKDYYAEDYDGQVNVATSLRQPGSSFKPFVYMMAFANGYNPNTILFDTKTDFPTESGNYSPNNYSGGFSGPVNMRRSLAQSLNITAVKTLYLVGVDKVLDMAEQFGYTSFTDRARYGLALVLGGGEVTLLEHTSAFATFARQGVRHETSTIMNVTDQNGNVLYEWTNSEEQVIDAAAVQQLNSVLSDPGARAGFTALNIPGKTLAAKTGTTNDYRDAWTMAYTPSFATGVWVGNNDNSTMNAGAAGLIVAAPIMNDYMSRILDGLEDETFDPPPPAQSSKAVLWGQVGETVEKVIDKETGRIIPDECIDSYPEEYKQNREFKEAHSILHYVQRDNPNGAPPSAPEADPHYNNWETSVNLWATGQEEYVTEETELEDCNYRAPDQIPTVTIVNPVSSERYTSRDFRMDVSIDAGINRSLSRVEYIIDDTLVEVRTTSPFSSSYKAQGLTTGNHTLTVRATNDRSNTSESSVSFTYSAPEETPEPDTNSNNNKNNNKNTNNSNNNTNDSSENTNSDNN